ncbi:hypothetical protein LEP1GSC005_2475 [Leptospira santarosai str. ST188]|nr:hypothetical protein LEP1GSC005_2475 [Leptospira santarosai str. ST188]
MLKSYHSRSFLFWNFVGWKECKIAFESPEYFFLSGKNRPNQNMTKGTG